MITTIYLEVVAESTGPMLVRCDLDEPDDVIEFCWPDDSKSSQYANRWLPSGYKSADTRGQNVGLVRIGQYVYRRESDWSPKGPEELRWPVYDWDVIEVITPARTDLIVFKHIAVTDMEGYREFGDFGPIYPPDPKTEDDKENAEFSLNGAGDTPAPKVEPVAPSTEWSHRYSVTECPECGCDLTSESGVTICGTQEGFDEALVPSSLEKDGLLIDAFNIVENGYHSDTICGQCGLTLSDYEVY